MKVTLQTRGRISASVEWGPIGGSCVCRPPSRTTIGASEIPYYIRLVTRLSAGSKPGQLVSSHACLTRSMPANYQTHLWGPRHARWVQGMPAGSEECRVSRMPVWFHACLLDPRHACLLGPRHACLLGHRHACLLGSRHGSLHLGGGKSYQTHVISTWRNKIPM